MSAGQTNASRAAAGGETVNCYLERLDVGSLYARDGNGELKEFTTPGNYQIAKCSVVYLDFGSMGTSEYSGGAIPLGESVYKVFYVFDDCTLSTIF